MLFLSFVAFFLRGIKGASGLCKIWIYNLYFSVEEGNEIHGFLVYTVLSMISWLPTDVKYLQNYRGSCLYSCKDLNGAGCAGEGCNVIKSGDACVVLRCVLCLGNQHCWIGCQELIQRIAVVGITERALSGQREIGNMTRVLVWCARNKKRNSLTVLRE